MLAAQVDAEAELCIVLKQGVGPGRTLSLAVGAVGRGGAGGTIDGRAARSVGDEHTVAKELGKELDVRSLAAAGACTGELEQRPQILRTLDGLAIYLHILFGEGNSILPVGLIGLCFVHGHHLQGLVLSQTHVYAVAAAGAIQGADLHTIGEAIKALAGGFGHKALGLVGLFFGIEQEGTNGGMGADQCALVAHDALCGIPYGHFHGNTALLVFGGSGGHGAVGSHPGYGKAVALLRLNGLDIFMEVRIIGHGNDHSAFGGGGPTLGILDLYNRIDACIDGVVVLLHHGVTLLGIGLLGSSLHEGNGIRFGDHVGQLEESSLHDGVDTAAHAHIVCQLDCIDIIELHMVLGDGILHGGGEFFLHILQRPLAVEQEGAALLDTLGYRVAGDIYGVMAGHEVGAVDEVRALNGGLTEAQMAYGQAAGLLGVIGEIALGIHIGMVADDLDAVLVGANGTVGTEAIELAADGAGGRGIHQGTQGQAGEGHIVYDTHGEVVLGLSLIQIVVYGLDHGGIEFLAAQAITSAHDLDITAAGFLQSGDNILIQGLTQTAGLLGAVQNGQTLAGGGDSGYKLVGYERTIEANLDKAQLFAVCIEVIDGLFGDVCAAAHDYDDLFGIGSAHIVKEMVVTAGKLAYLLHIFFHNGGNSVIILIGRFTILEVDIGVLVGAAYMRMIGVHGTGAELLHGLVVQELAHIFIVDGFDLLYLMGGTEPVKEVHKGHGGLDGGQMGHQGQIHDFLYGSGGQHGKTGLTAGHNVAVIAENGQCMGRQCTGGYMEHAGQQLAADLVHIGDHQKKSLRSRKGSGQSARLQRTVHCTGSAALALHLSDAHFLSEQIYSAVCSPFICHFRHGR